MRRFVRHRAHIGGVVTPPYGGYGYSYGYGGYDRCGRYGYSARQGYRDVYGYNDDRPPTARYHGYGDRRRYGAYNNRCGCYDVLDDRQKATFHPLQISHEVWSYVSDYSHGIYPLYGTA